MESSYPLRGDAAARRPASRPGVSIWPARLAGLETELARLKEERGLETDTVAEMLVRVAESERALEAATRRAVTAETTAHDVAALLERTRADLADAKRGVGGFESMLAQARAEHEHALEAARNEHAAHIEALERQQADDRAQRSQDAVTAARDLARALEGERSAAARARQQAAAAEEALRATRAVIAQAATLVDDLERREETATALRVRALQQARTLLSDPQPATAASPPDSAPPAARPMPKAALPKPRQSMRPTEPAVDILSFEDLNLDLPE